MPMSLHTLVISTEFRVLLPFKRSKTLLASLLGVLLGLQFCALSWAQNSTHNHSALPIWSDISYFERSTLSDWHKALKGDPNALLALYIMASGRHSYSDYDRAKGRIEDFVRRVEPDLKRLIDPWQQGELLNREMHKTFYPESSGGRTPLGYDEDQSR